MCTTGLTYQLFGFPRVVTLNSSGLWYDSMYIHAQESYAAQWLGQNREPRVAVFSERIRLLESQGGILSGTVKPIITSYHEWEGSPLDGYIFLRYMNVIEDKYVGPDDLTHDFLEAVPNLFEDRIKLYDNGGSEIYR